jgi:hypothetical protein
LLHSYLPFHSIPRPVPCFAPTRGPICPPTPFETHHGGEVARSVRHVQPGGVAVLRLRLVAWRRMRCVQHTTQQTFCINKKYTNNPRPHQAMKVPNGDGAAADDDPAHQNIDHNTCTQCTQGTHRVLCSLGLSLLSASERRRKDFSQSSGMNAGRAIGRRAAEKTN